MKNVFPELLPNLGVQVVIVDGTGRGALDCLAQNGIAVHAGQLGNLPETVLRASLNKTVSAAAPTCGHNRGHDCPEHGQACHGESGGAR